MFEPDLEDYAVDPSRVLYGIRRYWWIIVIFAVVGALVGIANNGSRTVFDVELRQSPSRMRLVERANGEIALLPFLGLVDVMNSPDLQAAVDSFAGEAVEYSAASTPSGLVALRVVASSENSARKLSSDVVTVLNKWLSDEQRDIVGQRVSELTQSTDALAEKIDSIEFSTGDDVTAILERSSLIDALVQDQRDLAQLTVALNSDDPGSTQVRTAMSNTSSQDEAVLGFVAGVLVGLAIAAGLGLARRRVRDATDLRRIVGQMPVFITTVDASPSATAALVTGIVGELGGQLRSPTSVAGIGESTDDLVDRMLGTSSKYGLGLERAEGDCVAADDQMFTLVAANADWAAALGTTPGSSVLLVVRSGEPIDTVTEQIRLFRVSRLPLIGCVLVS